ncbi:potassium:proton antiporter [Acinetobacter sp. LoGeW2-3]|uniref:cation:proton antiporter domain-containing protein n=1 Tax=Acinetobacter sp. LoGeW2-3 TaxID=1808001 RepID=UPI000C05AD15|nr:cation:proton antiporter [Acinetobacter sp. LoGeW2-3]ATO18855.1 potassium:proton antiporter [Acinetobacter sp. LoGeW2-3]
MSILLQITFILAAALLIVPMTRYLKLPAVLGYLFTGLVLGSGALNLVTDPELQSILIQVSILSLLFWVGLQLRPQRFVQMPQSAWISTAVLVLGSGGVLTLCAAIFLQQNLVTSVVIGLAGSLSAMTLSIQHLMRQEQLMTSHGQLSYISLLIQALVLIPLIAIIPLFSGVSSTEHGVAYFAAIIATFTGLFLCNRYLMQPLYRWIARSSSHDLHALVAIFVTLGLLVLMQTLGLTLYLGALFAGILLADSDFRPHVENAVQPFHGVLIGLSFISIGLSIQLSDVVQIPGLIIGGALLIILSKFMISLAFARYYQNSWRTSTLTAVSLAQGGEFTFVLLTIAITHSILNISLLSPLLYMLALSMLMTPALYWLLDRQILPRLDRSHHLVADFDIPAETLVTTPILLIGFGRFGQIVARVLHQQGLKFSVMDSTVEATDLLKEQEIPFYQVDATETSVLQLVDIASKDQVIVAIDDIEDSLLVVRHLRWNYPNLKLWVRARDRHHAHLLHELGVEQIFRETYLSALALTQSLLAETHQSVEEAEQAILQFRQYDETLLKAQQQAEYGNESLRAQHHSSMSELSYLFEQDQHRKSVINPIQKQQNINATGIDAITDDLS